MTKPIPRKLAREVWPPSLVRVTIKQLADESPMHPKQLKLKREHMRKAEVYWQIRHAETTRL
jgi:hypothetical protein